MEQTQCPNCKDYDVYSIPNMEYKGEVYEDWKHSKPTLVNRMDYFTVIYLIVSIIMINIQTIIREYSAYISANYPSIYSINVSYTDVPINSLRNAAAIFSAYVLVEYALKRIHDSRRKLSKVKSTDNACRSCRYSWSYVFDPPKPFTKRSSVPPTIEDIIHPIPIPKFSRDIAMPITALLVSLASITAGLLGLMLSPAFYDHANQISHLPTIVRPVTSLLGVALVIGASITLDNVIDNLSSDDWSGLLGEKFDVDRNNNTAARVRLFNGGYVAVSVFFGFLGVAMLYLGFEKTNVINESWFNIMLGGLFLYIVVQMMTNALGHGVLSLLAFAGLSYMVWFATGP